MWIIFWIMFWMLTVVQNFGRFICDKDLSKGSGFLYEINNKSAYVSILGCVGDVSD